MMTHSNSTLYTEDGKQLYGALQANPTGEQSYPHLSDLGGAGAFAASAEFGKVTNSNPLKLNCKDDSGKLNQAAVQQIVQVKDLSDMVLMDFIMSQADRFSGNMHSQKIYVWIENGAREAQDQEGRFYKGRRTVEGDSSRSGSNQSHDHEGQRRWPYQREFGQELPSSGQRSATWTPRPITDFLTCKRSSRNRKSPSGIKPSSCLPLTDFKTMKGNVDQAVEYPELPEGQGAFFGCKCERRSRGGRQAGTGDRNDARV